MGSSRPAFGSFDEQPDPVPPCGHFPTGHRKGASCYHEIASRLRQGWDRIRHQAPLGSEDDEVEGCWVDQIDRLSARKPREDRKSTRLNSSHLVISYAVFCLTKQ